MELEEAEEVVVEADTLPLEIHHTTHLPTPLVTPVMDTKATLHDTATETLGG